MSEAKDPWASLADTLGAAPNREASPPPAQRPPEKPRQPPRPEAPKAAAPRTTPGWDDLDTSLGLPPTREAARPAAPRQAESRQAEPRPATPRQAEPRVSHEPPPYERPRAAENDRPRPLESDRPRPSERDRPPTPEAAQPRGEGDEPGGEGRPRRRRGRRGGRGRGGRGRREEGTAAPQRDDSRPHDVDLDAPTGERLPAGADAFDDEPRPADRESAEPGLDEDGRPRRRRRRRGRRGGRREATAGERSGDVGPEGSAARPAADRTRDDLDEEPLPSGYGRPQAARQPDSRDPEPRGAGGERRGRRRRRGRGDDTPRRPAAEAGGDATRRRGRRSRRSADDERTSSSSSLARRSRDDFAPVSRGYDEDDEGLEFLGLEEAGSEPQRRDQRHVEDDDVLVESGLNAVRDVPSWVEAIGIVIAGNLDARSRPRADRDDDRRRRDR
jgi:hypothetical protein